MSDKVRIFINSNRGKLEAFEIDSADLYTIQVSATEDLESSLPFDPTEYLIRTREKEGWRIILGCEIIGRLTEKHHDLTITKQYYKKRGAELRPLKLPPPNELIEMGFEPREAYYK
jgi:hypothetical protein